MPGDAPLSLEEHLPRIYRVALRIVADADVAEDVLQEVCMRAVCRQHEFQGHSRWSTWLHRVAVNCSLDHLRRCQRQRRVMVTYEEAMAQVIPDPSDSPETLAQRRELYELAAGVVRRLPADCQSAFVLTQLDGYSYDEAAEILGAPRGTIASRVHRAKKMLVDSLPSSLR